MITANEAEVQAMMRELGWNNASTVWQALRARAMLITRAHNGWDFHPGREEAVMSPAVRPPRDTDFVGCGDYAAAGAVHAALHGTDLVQTINEFIGRNLAHNVVRRD